MDKFELFDLGDAMVETKGNAVPIALDTANSRD